MRNAEDTPADGFPRVTGPLPRRQPEDNRPDWTAPGEADALANDEALRYAARRPATGGAPWGAAPEPPRPPGNLPPSGPAATPPASAPRRAGPAPAAGRSGESGPGPAVARSGESGPRGQGPAVARSGESGPRGPGPAVARSGESGPRAASGRGPPRSVPASRCPGGPASSRRPRPRWGLPAGPRRATPPRLAAPGRVRWPRCLTRSSCSSRRPESGGPGADHMTSVTAPELSAGRCSPPPSPGSRCRKAQWDCSPAGGGWLTCWHSAPSGPGCWCSHSCCRRREHGAQPRGRRTSQGAWPADEGIDLACPRSRWRIRSSNSTATR